jgi:hypothetical protein
VLCVACRVSRVALCVLVLGVVCCVFHQISVKQCAVLVLRSSALRAPNPPPRRDATEAEAALATSQSARLSRPDLAATPKRGIGGYANSKQHCADVHFVSSMLQDGP